MTAQASMEQGPGDLDDKFANSGMINIPDGSSRCVVETSAGKLLYVALKNNSQWVYRALSGGTSDPVFKSFEWNFAEGLFERPTCLLAREDGKFDLIGDTGKEPFTRQAAITRFNESGSPDLVFSTVKLPLPVNPVPPGQGLQTYEPTGCLTADNQVLVGTSYQLADNDGFPIDSAGYVYNIDDQGKYVKWFNGSEELEVRFNGPITKILSLSSLPDGRIVVFGTVDRRSGDQSDLRAALACYNRDGTLDKTFGNDGSWENDDFTSFGAMVVHDGKIIIAAVTLGDNDGKRYIAVYRLLDNGTSDPSFNNKAALVVDLNTGFLFIPCIAVQPDNKIVIAGGEDFPDAMLYWLRITEGGVLDTSFGNAGVVRQQGGHANDIIVQRAGNRIIIAADLVQGPKVLGVVS